MMRTGGPEMVKYYKEYSIVVFYKGQRKWFSNTYVCTGEYKTSL